MSKYSELNIEQREKDEVRRVDFKSKNKQEIDNFHQFIFDKSLTFKVGSREREILADIYQEFDRLFL